jgi:hypothetical protein
MPMKLVPVPALLAAALFSVVVSLPFLPVAAPTAATFGFEITVTSSQPGFAQLFYDSGHGINETDSARATVEGNGAPRTLRFALPAGRYTALRFDPLDRAASMTLADAKIRDSSGSIVREFAGSDFKATQDIAFLQAGTGEILHLEMTGAAADPITQIALPVPMALRPDFSANWRAMLRIALPVFLVVSSLLFALGRIPAAARKNLRARLHTFGRRPARAVAFAAAFGAIASSYPVVFLGKSFVSPNYDTPLLYDTFPTLPGYTDSRIENVKAADVGAVMWSHLPLSVVESRALFRDHELPLWNRYNSMGTPLLGQGQSMFGDPLHFLVLAANGAAWAWDLKYLLAKWLIGVGVGLCVLRATRHPPSAAIVAAIMPFIGYFVYRVNHPSLFSVCYAPWILLSWIGIVTATQWKSAAAWVGGLMLANWTELNSGTVKEAYISLLALNFAGVLALALSNLPLSERVRRFSLAVAGGLIFALLAAPVWLTFSDALASSYTGSNEPRAFQIQPSLALAYFDELFFRPFNEQEKTNNGSLNFVLLLGVLAFLINLRRIWMDRLARALTLAALPPLALIFGVIPPDWVVRVPFLGNVSHVDNTFFCPLITLLGVLAGFGFRTAAQRLGQPEGRGDLALAFVLLGTLVALYLSFGHTVQRSTSSYWRWGEHIERSPFVVGSLCALLAASLGVALVARTLLVRRTIGAAHVLTLVACAVVMLWRHGLHVQTGFADYTTAAGPRVDFHAPSSALAAARTDDDEGAPWRFVGLGENAFHGWMNVPGFEGIGGPDALVNAHVRQLQDALGLERIWDWRLYAHATTLPAQKRAFDFLNVRHYFDRQSDPATLSAILSPVKMADLNVYRSESAWPRAFFTDRIAGYAEAKDLARLVQGGDGRPFAAMQNGDSARPAGLSTEIGGRAVVPATHYRLTNNATAFDVQATGPGIVVLTEAWLRKDFRARVDGKPIPYLRVNHAFKGVAIESAGLHRVEFEYWPRRFTEALALSAIGFGALLGAVWFVRSYPRPP